MAIRAMISNALVVFIAGSGFTESLGSFAYNNLGPYSMTQGIVVGNPGQVSPIVLMPTSTMNSPIASMGFPLFGGASNQEAPYPAAGLHVGQIQTTFLRGSPPAVRPEPVLPKFLPPLDNYKISSVGAKSPTVFISPTDLLISHHHVLETPQPAAPVTTHLEGTPIAQSKPAESVKPTIVETVKSKDPSPSSIPVRVERQVSARTAAPNISLVDNDAGGMEFGGMLASADTLGIETLNSDSDSGAN